MAGKQHGRRDCWFKPFSCLQVSFALAKAATEAAAKRGTKRKADGETASPEPVSSISHLQLAAFFWFG